MSTRLADTRSIQTVDDAKALFSRIAQAEIELARRKAASDSRIAKLTALYEEDVAPLLSERDAMAADLKVYILAHQEQFEKPRAVVTDFGKFGLRDVANVEVLDDAAVLRFAADHHLDDLVKTTKSVVKTAIAARLRCGDSIPGARLVKGEAAFYTVDKALIDQPPPSA